MPRPMKGRNVCALPKYFQFEPHGAPILEDAIISMSIDEYEAMRLIDLEGLTQEQCATQMNIARTTVQAIYADARKKIADAIVNAKRLTIEGGTYHLCDGLQSFCRRGHCQNKRRGGQS